MIGPIVRGRLSGVPSPSHPLGGRTPVGLFRLWVGGLGMSSWLQREKNVFVEVVMSQSSVDG